ncbi:50S ribosomal protein L16 [Candidatus Babeliales bacterium]|nr:50S ribosomal protein L16 [Candidatus Babeliales bacterium]
MLMPKKTKYRKSHRGRMKGLSKGARSVDFGDYGICALEPGWLTSRQIEAMRVALSRKLKKIGEYFIRVFPDKPISKKALGTRMGKGKGNPEFWVAVVKRGRVIAEVKGVDHETAKSALKSVCYKLPMKMRFVASDSGDTSARSVE